MSLEDEYNVATRYRTVRKHLDSLGYIQALTLDALPLIEKLLADLIQTTESLKHFKSIAEENIEAHTQLQSTIDPYKCDNVRLVQECNELHLDLMKERDNHQKQIKDFKKDIYKLEHECSDLQLASSRNLHRIKELETESAKKSKRILELQGKCLKPTISNVGLASKKRPVFPLRRPVIEGEPLPKTGAKSSPLPNLSIVEPKVVDLLSMADHKMNCLSHEVTKLKEELSLENDNVQTLKCQLTTKEKEILRLKKMLEGGRPYTAVSRDCACKKGENSYVMSSHNVGVNELKVLQQEKLELEQQLKEALSKQHDAMTQAVKLADRNEELEKELRDIDHIALAVEADCNSAVKENNKRVSKLQEKLEGVMTRIHVLESELTVERREVQELRADLEACRLEKLNIQRNLESALDEKKQMTNRINELTVIEKNLNEEIGRMANENDKQKQDIIQLQYNNKILKDRLNSKQVLLNENGTNLRASKEKGQKNDYNREQNGADLHEMYKERDIFSNGSSIGYNNIIKQLEQKDHEINDLQHVVEQLRRERDFYKNEYNSVKDNFSKTVDKDNVDLWSRIRELKRQLSERENALDELHREKKELFREKTNLETRLQNCKGEHKTPYRSCNICKRGGTCNCSPPLMRDGSQTKNIIERLEHERDIARADVDRLIEERDALRERLKMAAEAHTSEQRRLRENLTDVETRLKQIEKERQELLLTQGTRRATINGLEDQLQDLREELRRTKQELGTQRTQYFQLRALQDQTDQALGDAQNQLTQSDSELNKALDRNRTMERQYLQLESQVKELQQDIHNFKANMTHLDHEKDQLLMVLDEKTEKIATLERELMLKEQQAMGIDHQIRELQHKNELCVDQSADQERQMRSMQLEMENLQRQLQTVSYDRENAIQENRRVQDDLAAVTCEVRNLQRELEASRAESSDLKRQLQTYVSEVRRAEDLLNRKENERTEMLNHFRSLSLEATVLENNNHSLESEAAEAKGALQSTRDRMLDLERQAADKDGLIRGYEAQISELTQNIAGMESQLRQQGDQRHRAEADLTAVRDLCVKLDHQKDTLMQQLDDKDALKTQYDMQIAKLKAEQAVIQDQMSKDRATVDRLELLLDQARQESITVQANNQELQNEMSRLRSKMSELQNKLSSESTKLGQYKTQAAEYCKQISELRRQVTNERFDRARKDEENRRQSEGPPDSLAQALSPNNSVPNVSNDVKDRQKHWLRKPYTAIPKYPRVHIAARSVNERHSFPLDCKCLPPRKVVRDPSSNRSPSISNNEAAAAKPNNSSNLTRRYSKPLYLQSETSREPDGQTDRSRMKVIHPLDVCCSGHLCKENNYRCNHTKEFHRDVPCINIILRSDCKVHSSIYNCVQKNTVQAENVPQPRKHEESVRTDCKSLTDASQFDSLNQRNVDHVGNAGNRLNLPQPSKMRCCEEFEDSKDSRFNNIFQTQYSVSPPFSFNPVATSTPRRTQLFSNVKGTNLRQTPTLMKDNVDKFIEYPPISSKNFPVKRLDTIPKELNESRKVVLAAEPNLSCSSNKYDSIKHDSVNTPETKIKSILKSSANYMETDLRQKCINALDNSEYKMTENALKTNTNYTPYRDSASVNTFRPDRTNASMRNNEFQSTVLTNKIYYCDRNTCGMYNSTGNHETSALYRDTLKTKKLTDSSIQENGDFCTNTCCTSTDCCKLNCVGERERENETAAITKSVICTSWKPKKNIHHAECDSKCISTIDSALDILQNMLKGVKKFKGKERTKYHIQDTVYQHREVRCKNVECNYPQAKSKIKLADVHYNQLKSLGIIKPECIKMLKEIKRHTETLEEQLTIMNNSIRTKRKEKGLCKAISENCAAKQQRDIVTQNPEKKNIYVQEPCLNDTCGKSSRGILAQANNTVDPQHVKNQGVRLQEINTKCVREKHVATEDRSHKKSNRLKEMENAEIQCERRLSLQTFDSSNVKPLASSTLRKFNLSNYTQTTSLPAESLRTPSIHEISWVEPRSQLGDRKDDTINSVNVNEMGKICSDCDEDDVVMLLLTKCVNNTCLKSRYKKLEFLNFRPKCIANSCAMYDHRSVRCKLSRGKSQIPIVFKLKSACCETGYNCQSVENICECLADHSTKCCGVADLERTVCTQSSDTQITTATSVPSIPFNYRCPTENCVDEGTTGKDSCTIS